MWHTWWLTLSWSGLAYVYSRLASQEPARVCLPGAWEITKCSMCTIWNTSIRQRADVSLSLLPTDPHGAAGWHGKSSMADWPGLSQWGSGAIPSDTMPKGLCS